MIDALDVLLSCLKINLLDSSQFQSSDNACIIVLCTDNCPSSELFFFLKRLNKFSHLV